jgi:hypothetical protein
MIQVINAINKAESNVITCQKERLGMYCTEYTITASDSSETTKAI